MTTVYEDSQQAIHRHFQKHVSQSLRQQLYADALGFATRVLRGEGKPQEVAILPALLNWLDGIDCTYCGDGDGQPSR